MKNTLCASDIKQCACSMWEGIKRPTVRQSLHYEISLLPTANASADRAFKLRLGGTHVCPLWKVVLVVAAMVIALSVACKCKCKCEQNSCDCP